MADYYDRLEAELARLTESGAYRSLRTRRVALPRVKMQLVAVAASMLVVLAVGAALLSAGSRRHPSHHLAGAGKASAPIRNFGAGGIRNFSPAKAPAPSGLLLASSHLAPAHPGGSPTGHVSVYGKPPSRYEISISASGLRPNAGRDAYAVWLVPIVYATSGSFQLHAPKLVGVIRPSVGRDGKLAAEGLLPQDTNGGAYRVLITVEPAGSTKGPGRTVLKGLLHAF